MPSVIYGYARVSTDDQNFKLQDEALEKFGVKHILRESASGKTMDRPIWNFLAKTVRPGDTVVVWKLDRLGRTLTGVLQAIEVLQNNNIKLVSIMDGFDTRTPMGNAMMQISLVFAELERKLISERTKAGIAAARKEGKTFGRKPLIVASEKRLNRMRELDAVGELRTDDGTLIMSREAILKELNKADKSAKPVKNVMTVKRWQDAGFPGLEDRGEAKEED